MRIMTRVIAAVDLLLISPAALFMTALIVRNAQPPESEPAHTAQRIVLWYAERMWTLWGLLLALPLAVFLAGCATLFRNWNSDAPFPELLPDAARQTFAALRADPATLFVAAATLAAGGILVTVILHMLAN